MDEPQNNPNKTRISHPLINNIINRVMEHITEIGFFKNMRNTLSFESNARLTLHASQI